MPTPGSPPGTLVARDDLPAASIRRIAYNREDCEEKEIQLSDLAQDLQEARDRQVWVDVQGLGDAGAITAIGAVLGLHPLTLEDIVHVHQRPKIEEFDDYLFIVARAIRLAGDRVDTEQISLVLKDRLVVTFQEQPGDGFDPVRRRLREGKGAIRSSLADYLAYALIDTVIDNYFPVLERYGDIMDRLDEEVLEAPTRQTATAIHATKRELRAFRRAVWPLREVIGALGRDGLERISPSVRPALRDCHDHVVQVADFVETSRERVADLVDLYIASVSEKTNQVMKVLTIIATIFIPLTFLAGLYGMNFDPSVSPFNMPELKWRYGYPAFWVVLVAVLVTMLLFFRRKGWFGSADGSSDPGQRRDADR
jgi:magnesium transporter